MAQLPTHTSSRDIFGPPWHRQRGRTTNGIENARQRYLDGAIGICYDD
jgi:hypothetical protein